MLFRSDGKPLSINLCMAGYRADRIRQLIAKKPKHTIDDMKIIQTDLYSLQAERFLKILGPMIPQNKAGEILSKWDLKYDRDSKGATIFHQVYMDLMGEIFGKSVYGNDAWSKVGSETSRILDFYFIFDRILLDCPPDELDIWFGLEGRGAVFERVMNSTLQRLSLDEIPTWGEQQSAVMTNLFFGGKLPAFFGFDHGPVAIEGCRATVVQGSMYKDGDKTSAFCPCYRFITDLQSDWAYTVLAGGHTDRRFSPYYKNEIQAWLNFDYKKLAP